MKFSIRLRTRAAMAAREFNSAPNAQPLDQRLVTRLIGTSEVIEQLTPLGHELEQSTPGMVVLDVALEVLGQIVDAFRQDRYLHLRGPCVAGFGRIRLDDFRLACGRDRHRVSFCSGSNSAAGPGCRPARSLRVLRASLPARNG